MSTLKGFSGKTFYAAAPALDNTGNRNVMTCLVVLMMLCGVIVAIVLLLKPSTYQNAQDAPQAVIPPHGALTPIAPATDQTHVSGNAIRNPGFTPCTQVSAECGSIATPSYKTVTGQTLTGQTPVVRHVISSDERKALAVIYPTSAPIPVDDRECYYAAKLDVSCADVKAATEQMKQWMAEEGR